MGGKTCFQNLPFRKHRKQYTPRTSAAQTTIPTVKPILCPSSCHACRSVLIHGKFQKGYTYYSSFLTRARK